MLSNEPSMSLGSLRQTAAPIGFIVSAHNEIIFLAQGQASTFETCPCVVRQAKRLLTNSLGPKKFGLVKIIRLWHEMKSHSQRKTEKKVDASMQIDVKPEAQKDSGRSPG